MTSTKILVTGGAGFIGSHYVRTLLGPLASGAGRTCQITVLDKLTYAGNPANLDEVRGSDRFAFVQGDICDAELVNKLVGEHDQVVHFAAESHVDRSILGATEFVQTNVVGTQTLLDAALRQGLSRFVHVSTDEVYGSIAEGSWPETDPLAPNSPYSASKASSDLIALAYHRTHGLDVRVTRCSNNYGHHHFPEKVIPLFITNLLDGLTVPLYGDGLNVRDWLHIDDHVAGIDLVRTKGRGRRDLQHRRRHRTEQPRADRAAARGLRRDLGERHLRRRPQGPRPPLLGRLHEDPHRTRLRAAQVVRGRAGRDRRVVPRQPRLVGAAQGARGAAR